MIYSILNYNVFQGNFLSYEMLLLSGEDIYDRIDNKMPGIFKKKVFKTACFKNSSARAIKEEKIQVLWKGSQFD